ncbi:MAG: transglutaminase family protein [Bacteroidetes bacterium]|nr:transglutaminase family protein [Bacteroidota bacterium]
MLAEGEINALIHLLDDNDLEVFRHVHDKIVSLGTPVIPVLEKAWNPDISPVINERIEEIIVEIQFQEIEKDWTEWVENGSPDLFTGFYLVSKYHYPVLLKEEVKTKLHRIKQTIWLELNYHQTPLEQIQIFNQLFYDYHHFKGEQASTDFVTFCFPSLLESKKGNAISLGILYQILASELNLPVYGVNLFRHYILSFCKHTVFDFTVSSDLEKEVMFYINPINKGIVFSRNEIKEYLKKSEIESSQSYFVPASAPAIIRELLSQLIEVHTAQGAEMKVKHLIQLQEKLQAAE